MHHIFVETDALDVERKHLTVTGDNFHHMVRVLRMKEGDEFSVSVRGEEGKEYRFGIENITEEKACCILRFVKEQGSELPARVILLQGLPKADKMEMIIQKTVELGISEIVPVSMKRSIVKLDDKKAASRVERWNKIAESAASQSKRGIIPQVTRVMGLREALAYVKDAALKLIPYEMADIKAMDKTRNLIRSVSHLQANEERPLEGPSLECSSGVCNGRRAWKNKTDTEAVNQPIPVIAYIIGPEGGFAEEEVKTAIDSGFQQVTLGGRILRTETAGMVVMSWLMYELE